MGNRLNLNKRKQMNDREGLMMSAAIFIVAAQKGTDADVKVALKGDAVSCAYLGGKFGMEAINVLEELKRTLAWETD